MWKRERANETINRHIKDKANDGAQTQKTDAKAKKKNIIMF